MSPKNNEAWYPLFINPSSISGLPITCRDDEYAVFEPPTGQTCGVWASTFVDSFGGYLKDANATSHCQYCQFQVGDEYLKGLNLDYDNRWRDLGIVFAFFGEVANLLAAKMIANDGPAVRL